MNNLYHEHSDDIYQYIFFMIRDHGQAKDLMQDTFLRAYDNFHRFDGDNPRGWLFRIARNITIDYIRRKKPITYFFDIGSINTQHEVSAEHVATLNESERELYEAIGNLKVSYRDVILLRRIEGFSTEETADILEWDESKVRVTLSRAMKALKKQLGKEDSNHEAI
ncbi:RNA polymerase sigma factor [Bacillus alkalicola]|uniref:RNA polymerase sigma factor n=1 Tax=Evansella alkalicola TaxID=745819 RepID=A0ABS6JXU0_9BACI|nr:RNA polymerase sigma factor [Bacillus alkalicola]